VQTFDAVVIGAGHNGLVAANLLADADWSVVVIEATDSPGGAVRSVSDRPGWTRDLFSAFYPLAVASPVLQELDLDVRWSHAPAVLGHCLDAETAAVIHHDPERTAAGLDEDGPAWLQLHAQWRRWGKQFTEVLMRPFPPVRPAVRLARVLGPAGLLTLTRDAVTPLDRWTGQRFRNEPARALLAGCAMHTDLGPADTGSTVFGWLLSMLAQQHGFPVPVGGAGRLTDALVRRLNGDVRCGVPVTAIEVRGGAARGVHLADGTTIRARRAVLADVAAPILYRDLLDPSHLPGRFTRALTMFTADLPVVKVDWNLRGPVPWRAKELRQAGTVHLGGDVGQLRDVAADLRAGRAPTGPCYAVLGQMTTADPTRSPTDTETAWAYTHLPRGHRGPVDAAVAALEATIEDAAPGFAASVLDRTVADPATLMAQNPNLFGGTMNGGTSAIHQQLVLRPVPGLGRADTPVGRLFLAGCSAHPGGGVHGACGANAARAALAAQHGTYRATIRTANRALYGT
jgi:phytoene dehydrogenase-like protein